jgi:FkbM family methyltransferase
MGTIQSQIAKTMKWVLARQGLILFRERKFLFRESKFGLDPWWDVNRLANDWNYAIALLFDVGANDGKTTVAALRRFPSARVISFEPHPVTFSKLARRTGNNARVQAVNSALGSEIGEVAMFEYDDSTINSLTDKARYAVLSERKGRRIVVPSTTLDNYCIQHQIERIDVLKIDTEGFELQVLQGSNAMLQKRAIKFIYCEFNDLELLEGATGGALVPISALLRPHGYRFVASYNDYIATADGGMFCVSNCLFALPPSG